MKEKKASKKDDFEKYRQYKSELFSVLRTRDLKQLMKFYTKYAGVMLDPETVQKMMNNQELAEVSMHYAILRSEELQDLHEESREWLRKTGHSMPTVTTINNMELRMAALRLKNYVIKKPLTEGDTALAPESIAHLSNGIRLVFTLDLTTEGNFLHLSISYPDRRPDDDEIKQCLFEFFPDGDDIKCLVPESNPNVVNCYKRINMTKNVR